MTAPVTGEHWKARDRAYHEDPEVVASFDRRVTRRHRLEHKYFTLDPWVREIARHPAARVLDVGCGTGEATVKLLAAGLTVVSFDASAAMLAFLQSKVAARGLQATCVQGDAERLPFAPASFDAVVCAGVLHHLPDLRAAAAGLARVLKPGGRLYLAEPYGHRPWVSFPYHALMGLARLVRRIARPARLQAAERLITRADLASVLGVLQAEGLDVDVRYLVYWPVFCGIMPEAIAGPLMRWLNRRSAAGQRADIICLNGRKPS